MKISVIIPAYNAEPYIAQAIESCLRQTFPPHEIVVADDASTDRTFEIARSFPPPVKAIRLEKNMGVSAARNRAVESSTGDWLAFLDADDWFLPEKLERQRQCILDHPNAVLVYTGFRGKPINGPEEEWNICPPSDLSWRLRYTNPILMSSVLLRRDAFDAVGGFDPTYPVTQDWEIWLKVAERFSTTAFAAVPTPLTMYRKVAGSLSSSILRYANERQLIIENRSLYHTSGISRMLLRLRIHAFNNYDIACTLRWEGSREFLHYMLKSLALWPFPNRMLPPIRYRIAVVMLMQHLGWWSSHLQPDSDRSSDDREHKG